jgi:predicted DNA-binding transcriptional regulator
MTVHKRNNSKVVEYLRQLGFKTDQTNVYLYLLASGPQSVLSISRGLSTGRTKLYPLLDGLVDRQLINAQERHYGTSYCAAYPAVLAHLVNEQAQHLHSLQDGLSAAQEALSDLQKISPTSSHINEYPGLDGLKQLRWNLTQISTPIRVLHLAPIDKLLGKHFIDKTTGTLTNIAYLTNSRPHTAKIKGSRYLDSKLYLIDQEIHLYGATTALLTPEGGVEIQNQALARQQNKLFDHLWSLAN